MTVAAYREALKRPLPILLASLDMAWLCKLGQQNKLGDLRCIFAY